MFIGEEPKLIESRYLTMQLARRLPEQIPEEMNVQGGTFKLPSNMMVGRSNSSTFLDSKVSRDMRKFCKTFSYSILVADQLVNVNIHYSSYSRKQQSNDVLKNSTSHDFLTRSPTLFGAHLIVSLLSSFIHFLG